MRALATVEEKPPLGQVAAWSGVANCVLNSVVLGVRGRVHLRPAHVGTWIHFGDGTSARVYRETVVDAGQISELCVLLVAFRLRMVRGWGHALFRAESLLNTPLFVGFGGFRSKLWLANDERGVYRGLYEWDSATRAEHYARCLWRVLALVCVPGSIHYVVLPGLRRSEVLGDARLPACPAPDAAAWWRPVRVA